MQKSLPCGQMMPILGLLVLFLSPVCLSFSPFSSNSLTTIQTTVIQLDCTDLAGVIRPFAEINDGPLPIKNEPAYADLTEQYHQIGITTIRTHDLFGPTDITTIFPDWSADPTIESNYDFGTSDQHISSMIDAGCQVFYRLGESANNNETLRTPPVNFTKWAEVCKHIMMHYNEGWNQGFFYNIMYWEIWNEPDLSGFWNGTADQYYELYRITAETIKTSNSSLKIGGPCTSSITDFNYTERFLEYIRDHDVPLDFFSWHRYAAAPFEIYTASCYIRNLLDSYGFYNTENINTEWNIDILTPQRDKDNARNAAFTTCCLTVFQDAWLDGAYRYRGNQDRNWLMRFLGLDLSLFAYNGVYKRPALSYKVMSDIVTDTPLRISTPVQNASNGITYLAGISEDYSNISVVISNFDAPETTYRLEIENLPWEDSYSAVHYLIDETHHMKITKNAIETHCPYITTQTVASNSVHFYRLTNSSVIPDEGPEVARIPLLLRLRMLDPFTRLLTILLVTLIFT